MPHYVNRLLRRVGNLLSRHPSEVPHLDHLDQRRIFARQSIQSGIQIQQLDRIEARAAPRGNAGVPLGLPIAGTFLRGPRARVIHQHLPHHPRGDRQEMNPVR